MKKTHRAVLSILLVLALLATLPLTAMAESIGDNTTTLDPPRDVENGQEMQNNTGTIGTNKGTITNNGVQPVEEKPADPSSGTVNSNGYGGTIQNNYGTVVQNGAHSGAPTISNNYGVVLENYGDGRVGTNQSGGVVGNNHGGGTVWDNYGQVDNNADGKVTNNKDGGEVSNNGGDVSSNYGQVENYAGGDVTSNYDGGVVFNNGGDVSSNYGQVENYAGGDVTSNYDGGVVFNNGGTVFSNASAGNGEYQAGVINNGGTVTTNEVGGVVDNYKGTVEDNQGTVSYNGFEGTVTNTGSGSVTTNFGTVHESDGNTYYGLHGAYKDEDGVDTQYDLGSYVEGTPLNLDEKVATITRDGFKLTRYETYVYVDGKTVEYTGEVAELSDGDGTEGASGTSLYKIKAPTLLKLFWEKIASVFTPASSGNGGGGAETVELSTGKRYIGIGSVIFINEKGYKVVEIKDDAFVVVSYDALSDEDVQDLDALFAKLFTAEQQKLIKNIGQLLDSEDVLTVFGKPGNHPVYEISKDLVK